MRYAHHAKSALHGAVDPVSVTHRHYNHNYNQDS